jgi:ankyrin repeat protein
MHKAARFGQKEVSELLIDNGADVNAKNDDGVTPLDTAIVGFAFVARGEVIMHKHTETADLLRKHGGRTSEELKAAGE